MQFTESQQDAITLPCNLVVTAGAGSGKTYVLVERYLRLLTADTQQSLAAEESIRQLPNQSNILAITFTDKAAREMRDRVRRAIEERVQKAVLPHERAVWEEHRATIEAARIGTIHSFCAALLRSQPAETGLDPQFTVLDEIEAALLRTESVDVALSEVASSPALTAQFSVLQAEFRLDELRQLLHDMLKGGSEVRVAVAAMPTEPDALLALWQERLAAAQVAALHELRQNIQWRTACATIQELAGSAPQVDRLGSQVHTIAGWLEQSGIVGSDTGDTGIHPRATDCEGGEEGIWPDFSVIDGINLQGGSKKGWKQPGDKDRARDALRMLRDTYRAGSALLAFVPRDTLEQRVAEVTLALCRLYGYAAEHYTRRKEERDVLDFDDLERRTCDLLMHYPTVRRRWQAEFQAILVDEFQDTNDEQRAIMYALAGIGEERTAVPRKSLHLEGEVQGRASPQLFVVGDGKQSIYRFRGADVSVFQRVAADIGQQGGQVVALDTSFRTHATLLDWINRVSQAVFARERPLYPYEMPFEPLHAHRPPPEHRRCVELHLVPNASDAAGTRALEGRIVARRIKELVAGQEGCLVYDHRQRCWRTPEYGDIAILCQASTAFEHYETALREAGIPYLTTAGRGYYGRKEVQDVIHLLRVLNDPMDELSLVGVLRSPMFALDDATIVRLRFANAHSLWDAFMAGDASLSDDRSMTDDDRPMTRDPLTFARETLRTLYGMRGQRTVVELLRAALAMTGYLATISGLPDGAQRRVNVEKLIEAARRAGSSGLLAFSAYLEDVFKAEPREGEAPLESEGSVRMMTVHRSKGLEFPIVVLPDLGRGRLRQSEMCLARRSYGLALCLRDEIGERQEPACYLLARHEEQRMEQAERERLLYVALTRASDYLILSGPAVVKGDASWLSRLLTVPGYPSEADGIPAGVYDELEVWRH